MAKLQIGSPLSNNLATVCPSTLGVTGLREIVSNRRFVLDQLRPNFPFKFRVYAGCRSVSFPIVNDRNQIGFDGGAEEVINVHTLRNPVATGSECLITICPRQISAGSSRIKIGQKKCSNGLPTLSGEIQSKVFNSS